MSEFQYVVFRAIDRAVSKENLAFMRRQSSRAEITPWSFENEYRYGDFGGNALEMLRRGYDIHLHYTNFGTRKLLIRLPGGLPDPEAAKPYFCKGRLEFVKDPRGPAGTLVADPCYEQETLEELYSLEEVLDDLIPLRSEIMAGDLRPLYLMQLAFAQDMDHDPETTLEAPVPAGLKKLTAAQLALAEYYGLDESLVSAAANGSPPLPASSRPQIEAAAWIKAQPEARKNAWLTRLLEEESSAVRVEILSEYRQTLGAAGWPTASVGRTIAQLEAAAKTIAEENRRRMRAKKAAERAARLAKMARDPDPFLAESEQLVRLRNGHSYAQVAELLADLREALAGSAQADLAERHARKLREKNPTLRLLVSELRRRGFVAKQK